MFPSSPGNLRYPNHPMQTRLLSDNASEHMIPYPKASRVTSELKIAFATVNLYGSWITEAQG